MVWKIYAHPFFTEHPQLEEIAKCCFDFVVEKNPGADYTPKLYK